MALKPIGFWALAFGAWLGIAAGNAAAYRADPIGHRLVVLGRSVYGRPIGAVETGDLDSSRKVLVVGCIHGNECAGMAITAELSRMRRRPPEVDLWVVANINPDGVAAGTRGNARGVDLNRNFPWLWKRLGGVFNSGPKPLSEPESRIAYRLIPALRPTISIWFHQHLDIVDESGGNVTLERRFADLVGLRLERLEREPEASSAGRTTGLALSDRRLSLRN